MKVIKEKIKTLLLFTLFTIVFISPLLENQNFVKGDFNPQIPMSNVYAWYHLNSSSGTNVLDSSGNWRNGTTLNYVSWVSAKLNNGLRFNGFNQSVNCSNIASFERTDTFSFEFWTNCSELSNPVFQVISKLDDVAYRGYEIYTTTFGGGNDVNFVLINALTNYLHVRTNTSLPTGEWNHVVVTYDGSSDWKGVKIYFNGTEQPLFITQNNLAGTIVIPSQSLSIGKSDSLGNYYNGTLDETVIYNKVLSQADVTFRYNLGVGTELMSRNPTASIIYPLNNSQGVRLSPTCNVTISDDVSGSMIVTFYENTTGGWVLRQTNNSVVSGTVLNWTFSQANQKGVKYWWSVNVTDSYDWTNNTYTFRTAYSQPPVLTNPTPINGSYGIARSQSTVNVTIEDQEGDIFNYTIEGLYVTPVSVIGATNGSKSANLITPLPYYQLITWWVNATDVYGNQTKAIYYFTIKDKVAPVISNPIPANGTQGVSISLSSWSVDIYDTEGDLFNWTIQISNVLGMAFGNLDSNGTKTFSFGVLAESTNYTVYVNVTAYTNQSNATYWFITKTNSLPEVLYKYPNSTGINLLLSNISVSVFDDDGDLMNITFRTNKTDTWTNSWNNIGTNSSVPNGVYMSNQTFNNSGRYNTKWRWGNTTYYWVIQLNDGKNWTNETYSFTTSGSRYDVNTDGIVNSIDLSFDWANCASFESYLGLYDVNNNGVVNAIDLSFIWANKT